MVVTFGNVEQGTPSRGIQPFVAVRGKEVCIQGCEVKREHPHGVGAIDD